VKLRLATIAFFVFASIGAYAQVTQNNYELIEMFQADQGARRATDGEIDWAKVNAEDAERREHGQRF
jgi:hypothetical protein